MAAAFYYDPSLLLMTMAGGDVEKAARAAGLRVVLEGFASRACNHSPVSRIR